MFLLNLTSSQLHFLLFFPPQHQIHVPTLLPRLALRRRRTSALICGIIAPFKPEMHRLLIAAFVFDWTSGEMSKAAQFLPPMMRGDSRSSSAFTAIPLPFEGLVIQPSRLPRFSRLKGCPWTSGDVNISVAGLHPRSCPTQLLTLFTNHGSSLWIAILRALFPFDL